MTVNLIVPGTMYSDRINPLDFGAKKVFRFGSTQTTVGVDLYNALNAGRTLTYNNTFVPGGPWLQPITEPESHPSPESRA